VAPVLVLGLIAMTDRTKTGPLYAKLSALAPYPGREATAAQVVRWLTAQAMLTEDRSQADPSPPTADRAHLIGAQFAAAFFLEGMTQIAAAMSDPVTRNTVAAAADIMAAQAVAIWNGGAFATVLWNLAGDDALAIAAVAQELAAAMAAPRAQPKWTRPLSECPGGHDIDHKCADCPVEGAEVRDA
jgi:hypothetical protein